MRTKYSLEFKIKVAEKYLAGKASQGQLCKEFGLNDKKLVRVWVAKYQQGELTQNQWVRRTKFESEQDRLNYVLLENEYLKKKLIAQGESPAFIADLWSSRNPEAICQLKKDAKP